MLATRRILVGVTVLACASCGSFTARELTGTEAPAPPDFSFVGEMSPCYLELSNDTDALRVNCFHLDGVLHIHSSRWAKLPRLGRENWIVTVRRSPDVRVEIEDKIYALRASPIDDENLRKRILHDRGYWRAWDGITVVRFIPRA